MQLKEVVTLKTSVLMCYIKIVRSVSFFMGIEVRHRRLPLADYV